MFPYSRRLLVFFMVGLVGTGWARGDQEADVRLWDKMWANLPPGATTVLLGDQLVPIEVARAWRNRVAGIVPEGPTELSSQTGVNLWPGGNVYFDYDANVSAAHRVAFENAIKEWELAANIHFIPRTSQTNFIRVTDAGALGGGNSAVGMIGGMQILNIGTASWTREVILHEVGHALGIIHEHQRSDRDNYVTIVTANIQAGKEGNFVKIPTSTNTTVYDFLSVMHYFRNAFSTSSNLDTIVPLPAYTAYIDQMGIRSNPVISRPDRQAMAALYGAGPALSLIVKNTKDSGLDSLRAALVKASDLAEDTPGLHPVVSFEIPGTDPNFAGGVFTIRLTSPLQPYFNTVVDGTTQTAFTGNTNAAGPEIVITRATPDPSDGNAPGIEFAGSGSEIRGFVINGFEGPGVEIGWPTATLNTVAGCYIGVNAAGTAAVRNDYQGVLIRRQAHHNVIGGSSASARNLISGNGEDGVLLADANTTGNVVQGNWIGLNAAGAAAIPNFYAGVMVRDNAQSNTIGGDVAGAGNVISGNNQDGVMVYGPAPDNRVQGNLIGLNAAGTAAVGNGIAGITVAAAGTLVGGTTAAARNVVSGNDTGIIVYRSITTGSTISGNWIGLNAAGTSAVPNTSSGVSISTQASSNVIGGTSPGARNIISGNVQLGVIIQGTGVNGNLVQGNWIGLNGTGSAAIPNQFGGIQISSGATGNTIGGTVPGSGNIVSGNASSGVSVAAANSNTVTGNWIGLNAAGNGTVPNTGTGVIIFSGANNNIIGGTAPGAGNVIAGNTSYGIRFTGAGTTANTAAGNLVGLDPSGLSAYPNSPGGMIIDTSASGNFVGTPSGGRNYISGNTGTGIFLTADGNTVQGNTIGLSLEGAPVPNTTSGVTIQAKNTIVGGVSAGQANLISRNGSRGIIVSNTGNTGNRISGNSIYLNTSAAIDLNGGTTGTNGLTSNDSGDPDTGPNNLQNFPVISSAVLGASGTTVSGSLNSIASSTFTIQFFAAPTGGPANVGDLRYYLGQASVNTNGSGNATISTTLPIAVPAGLLVTATATDSGGNTSEAQAGVAVTLTGDSDADGIPDAYETANGLTIGVNDATLDRDGDGMSNLAEFRAGTGANNSSSVLRVTNVEAIGADFRLTFPSVTGRNYRIEYADALSASTVWRLMADQVLSAGGNLQIVDPGAFGRTSRFYRVQLQP